MVNSKKGLGRGIEALFEDNDVSASEESVQEISISEIRPNPYQPRRIFDTKALKELAASIEKSGVFQPIILRQPDKKLKRYEIIAGERRFRASKLAKKLTIPAIVRETNDEEMMEVAVLENLQREDLTPLEEAQAYDTLMEKLSLTQAEVAKRLGKSRPYIANYLRLLGLPKMIKDMLQDDKLSMGQARTLLGLKDKDRLVSLARRTVRQNLTVRQLEQIVNQMNGELKNRKDKKTPQKSVFVKAAEDQLQSKFGTKVALAQSNKKNGAGKIEISYLSDDDLSRILEMLDVDLN
ncbi:plasmid partition ParB protein [Paucilactobacillus vaccinostercus DSM 20634]|jgi:ParB family chromosome partitioning protein|uniref:Plasmid partition ParB protein n=1 Tax=Paucilactobacillus vaccinostercus DSM 20634 TaxID=1423813 RepID=A0A0R2A1D4_9LACO|nr:ParB/RepB/Spo0J family partition protein [Paucilactobacillus vaccinostercus]KRM60990.1 plasmid partition ParB protein [Paucilactobacillus vaccinostercus DSM 20634]RRG08389.1 MAG: ParB/RepB/Spo0J family partition protein [Lactobacillus sp.]